MNMCHAHMELILYSNKVQLIQTLLLLVLVSNETKRLFYYNNHKGYVHERTQPLTMPTPYWLWMAMVFIPCGYGTTANNQQTNNPKDGNIPSLGSQPESIIAFQDYMLYHCHHLASCLNDQDCELRLTSEACVSHSGEDSSSV